MITNISFIVIARNEGFPVRKCLKSLSEMPLKDCEVICIDSDSSDDTLEVMKLYSSLIENFYIFKICGNINASVARNVGIEVAVHDFIYFIDGDVECGTEFVHLGIEILSSGKAEAITGKLSEVFYNELFSEVIGGCDDRRRIKNEAQIFFTGGIFLAKKCIVEKVGLFDEKLIRNQDLDYTLRLSRYGRMLAIPVYMGIHHTRQYEKRTFEFLRNGYPMFFGLLIRRNLDRPKVLISLFSKNKGFLLGFCFYGIFLAGIFANIHLSGSYEKLLKLMALIIGLDLVFAVARGKKPFKQIIIHYIYPLLVIVGIFLGGRSRAKQLKFNKVQIYPS